MFFFLFFFSLADLYLNYYLAETAKSLEESAREYQATHVKKTELQEVEIVTGEEDESNVLQVNVWETDNLGV